MPSETNLTEEDGLLILGRKYQRKKICFSLVIFIFGICILSLIIGLSVNTKEEPENLKIISRAEWSKHIPGPMNKVVEPFSNVIIIHTVTSNCSDLKKCTDVVLKIQELHVKKNHFSEIGYNFLIGGDGSIFEGRGWDLVGAHTKEYNNISLGLALIGMFDVILPTKLQLDSTKRLIQRGAELSKTRNNYKLYGHRQLEDTDSPGDALFKEIQTWPHFTDTKNVSVVKHIAELSDAKNISVVSDSPRVFDDIKIINRTEWSTIVPGPMDALVTPSSDVILIHTVTNACSDQDSCTKVVLQIQNLHINKFKFSEIGYNFLIGGDGSIFEGRGWTFVGAHTKGYNNDSIGIAFIGNFNTILPPKPQLDAAKKLIEFSASTVKIKDDYKLYGQRQLSPTDSPGDALFKEIQSWPHFVNTLP